MDEILPKITRARSELDRRGLHAELEVDGGIDEHTAPAVVRAGARVLVAGSSIFGHDRPWEAARRLRDVAEAVLAGDHSPSSRQEKARTTRKVDC
jgi:ribulose-phosphate 3-epimerase